MADKSLKCGDCDHVSRTLKEKRLHSIQHSAKKQVCGGCGKQFLDPKGLTLHQRVCLKKAATAEAEKTEPKTGEQRNTPSRKSTTKQTKKTLTRVVTRDTPDNDSVDVEAVIRPSDEERGKTVDHSATGDNILKNDDTTVQEKVSAKSLRKNLTNLDVKDTTPDTLQSPEQIQKKSVIQKRSSLPSSSEAPCSESSPADASASVDDVKKPRRTNKRKKEKFIVSSKLVAGHHDKNSPHPSKKIKIEDDLTPTYDISVTNDHRGRVTRSGLHVSCHCDQCMPCSGPCCENPAVRAGRCCDPATLGSCLQPLEVRFIIIKLRRNFYECECPSVRPFQTFEWHFLNVFMPLQ